MRDNLQNAARNAVTDFDPDDPSYCDTRRKCQDFAVCVCSAPTLQFVAVAVAVLERLNSPEERLHLLYAPGQHRAAAPRTLGGGVHAEYAAQIDVVICRLISAEQGVIRARRAECFVHSQVT